MNHNPRRRFFFLPFLLIALLATSAAVFWLWNNVLVAVVAVKPVGYWQAMGLLVLARLLFGGFRFGPPGGGPGFGGPPWRQKWQSMSAEEREKFKAEWRRRHGYKGNTD
ncbi:hypothetical protein [Spirosoma montaniterrae]|uniref:Uncharacterized protein n=1 Tax=Spirosoma montaniterrae TaxID=1178516 RepID=A0A1P9X2R3_9BACT|nr:hypothetical protein [Spirosoma montaniterrae]AQG81926.1 hypothetical protein AWR27_23090 [Spirosoma montaniterrae]